MWSSAWNKRELTSEISDRFFPSSVCRVIDWWSGGCVFKSYKGEILTKFILCCVTSDLSDNLTEMRQISLSWKTWKLRDKSVNRSDDFVLQLELILLRFFFTLYSFHPEFRNSVILGRSQNSDLQWSFVRIFFLFLECLKDTIICTTVLFDGTQSFMLLGWRDLCGDISILTCVKIYCYVQL